MKKSVIDELIGRIKVDKKCFPEMTEHFNNILHDLKNDLKEAHKQEIIKAFDSGVDDLLNGSNDLEGEQYYKETYLND